MYTVTKCKGIHIIFLKIDEGYQIFELPSLKFYPLHNQIVFLLEI